MAQKTRLIFRNKSLVSVIILAITVLVNSRPSQAATSAKDPDWHPTIAPFYAEENIKVNTNADTKKYAKCSNQAICVAKVTSAVDGDTIYLSTGEKVRYIGVDTPETKHPTKKVECFGQEAFEENKRLIQNKTVRLEKDVSDKDRYGRLLRYVYVVSESTDKEDIFVNDYLARKGYASAATFPPDVKFSEQFRLAEREAREHQKGLWAPSACEEKKIDIWDREIKAETNSVKKDYPKNHRGFRESLVKDILNATGAPIDRIGFWVYSLLKDIK